MADLATLYQGALLGAGFSTKLGATAAGGEDINQEIRGSLLASGVASGKINPRKLSSTDTASLAGFVGRPPPLQKTGGGGGILGSIEGALGTVGKVALNTAGDFASAVEGIPQGLYTGAEAAYRTLNPVGNAINRLVGLPTEATPKGPGLVDVGKGILKSTEKDFTNFDPMHPLYPALDVASVVSLGTTGAARLGATMSRLGEDGSALARTGEAMRKATGGGERAAGVIHPETDYARAGVQAPTVPAASYSISPFRRMVIEKPIDALYQSKLANVHLPGLPQDTTLNDLRSSYHIRNIANITRGRSSSTAVAEVTKATQGFNQAMKALLDESPNHHVAMEKFDAMVLNRMLATENLTPAERLERLSMYRERILMGPGERIEGVPQTAETGQIRQFYRNLTNSKEYRDYFANPTEAMKGVSAELDRSTVDGLKTLNLDPKEVLNRSLGPAAHIYNKTPEELLREQPAMVQAQTNFAMMAHEVEQAIKDAGGKDVAEEALKGKMAAQLPGQVPMEMKLKLVTDAIDSFKEDLAGDYSRRALNNNAPATGYLQGNTLAQKVAVGLHDRLGVDTAHAEPFATGGLHNYFPSASALRMKVRPAGGRIARAMDRLPGLGSGQATRPVLSEFKRGNSMRLLKAQELGVAPYSDFLHESDMSYFRAGVDRRDPSTFVRHVQQRERLLAHRLLSEPLQEKLALKDAKSGKILGFNSDAELQDRLGIDGAARYRLIPMKALRVMTEAENGAGKEVADILKESDGVVTPEISDHIDQVIDESAQETSRQIGDTAIAEDGKLVAMPRAYVDNMIRHAQILDQARGAGRLWQGFISRWRTAVLAYMPSWVLRTSMGHGMILYLGGVWNPTHYAQAMTYFGDGFKVPGTDIQLAKGLKRDLPAGIEQGSPHTDFSGTQNTFGAGRIAQATTHAVHSVANFQRRAAFLSQLDRVTRLRFQELEDGMKVPAILKTKSIDYVIKNHPEFVHDALNELDRISYTFGQMAPWERRLAKNFMPFYGWYKFVSKFVWTLPLTYPGRALAISRLGQLGASDQASLGPFPDWLRSSLMFDTHNLQQIHYLSMLGLNPLGDIVNPAGGFQGLMRLGQLSPIIQATLEGAGYNTLTGGLESIDPTSGIIEVNGQYIDLKTGKSYENLDSASPQSGVERFIGGLAREFPEIRIGEQFYTSGHAEYPESVPFVSERPIPLSPGSKAKSVTPASLALQYLGVAPKTYNLSHYQQNLLSNIARARGTYINSLIKQRSQGILPKVKVK